jgi:beta-mannosidase
MESFSLGKGHWKVRAVGESEWVTIAIPGEVHVVLMQAGRIPDPFQGENELVVHWVAQRDWEFYGTNDEPDALLDQDEQWLVFDGLDSLAEVSLNGVLVGKAKNAFRTYAWEVTEYLQPGVNEVRIVFASPVKYVKSFQDQQPLYSPEQSIPGGPYLRKAPCQWGWDWGPQLPPIGVWKDARLEAFSVAKFMSVHLRQAHKFDGSVEISAHAQVDQWADAALQLCMTLRDPSGQTFATTCRVINGKAQATIEIAEPRLWWPNGYGDQALYDARVTLRLSDEIVLDGRDYQIGLRTLELSQESDDYGESFTFVVNGVPIFAKGSNWIPADSFTTRITRERVAGLLGDAARAHHNMIRVWGGGFYESEDFYNLCDRYGLLVWQDFVFSCSIYPFHDQDFIENVHAEVIDNVRRIRHRACLALWCGNNEMDLGWEAWGWSQGEWIELREPYRKFFYETLPGWLATLDTDTPYWPSSPTSGTPFMDSNSNARGDAHYWEVWHGAKPFSAYREQYPRFMSEFGFQSLPPLKTIRSFADEDHWNLTDYLIEHHQRSPFASALFMGQMALHFMIPVDFPALVYTTMILQAEGIRFGVEHWRRNRHRVSGTLYWQLNDCWPAASWSSLDYFGRWKALHYASRRFYAPLLVSIEDDEQSAVMRVHLTNDLRSAWSGSIRWRLMRLDGEVLDGGEVHCSAEPLTSQRVIERDFSALSKAQKRETVFIAQRIDQGEVKSTYLATFVRNKHLNLVDPHLKAYLREEEGDRVTVTLEAQYLARFVELSLDNADVVFSDNYMDVLPREPVDIIFSKPAGWSIDDVGKSLTVFSLYDSFA